MTALLCAPQHILPLLQFLLVSSALPVSLTLAAQQLLKAFYLASRRVRVSNLYGTDIPVSALDSM